MSTLKEVAKDAGVSIATVSCCINGTKPVKPETKAKILDSIEKLKYIPNFSARNLKVSNTKTIGIILTDIDNLYHAEIFKGISSYFQAEGYSVSVAFSNNSPDQESKIIKNFISQNISGLLIITCQPQNHEFFSNNLINYHIPVIFIERNPENLFVNFAGFNNYQTIYKITNELLEKGYDRVGLVCGPLHFTSEKNALDGYTDALLQHDQKLDRSLICPSCIAKEETFKNVMTNLNFTKLQAIITTSESAASGTMEVLHIKGYETPKNILLFTLGEESWSSISRYPGIIHSSRTAYTLGSEAAELLLKNIESPSLFEPKSIILNDGIVDQNLHLAPASQIVPPEIVKFKAAEELRVLMVDGVATSQSIKTLAETFSRQNSIKLDYDFLPQSKMFDTIVKTADNHDDSYDIFMYDIPWLPYLVQNSLLMDITDFVTNGSFKSYHLFKENLNNCQQDGHFYGIPIIGGSQILFYRKDLFENRELTKKFSSQYQTALRPPKTWTEFNATAKFFTKSCSPNSPTPFGTSMAGITDEELAPELFIRLWAYGGSLWDSYNRPVLNTPENYKAFESILETQKYIPDSPLKTSISQTVRDFTEGSTAMLITYTEYASKINALINNNSLGSVGFEMLPGRRPASIGWNMGINPMSAKSDTAFKFFNWLCQYDTSFYITILDGQSPVTAPYHSMELLRLYPWLSITERSFNYVQKRTGPLKKNGFVVPQTKIESILCDVFKDITQSGTEISKALEQNQVKLRNLFFTYGYPKSLCNFF